MKCLGPWEKAPRVFDQKIGGGVGKIGLGLDKGIMKPWVGLSRFGTKAGRRGTIGLAGKNLVQ